MGTEDFKKRHKPKGNVSPLRKYLDDILELKDDGYTHEQICLYLLEDKGLEVHVPSLTSFINRVAKQGKTKSSNSGVKNPEKTSASDPSYFEKKKKPEVDLDELMNGDE